MFNDRRTRTRSTSRRSPKNAGTTLHARTPRKPAKGKAKAAPGAGSGTIALALVFIVFLVGAVFWFLERQRYNREQAEEQEAQRILSAGDNSEVMRDIEGTQEVRNKVKPTPVKPAPGSPEAELPPEDLNALDVAPPDEATLNSQSSHSKPTSTKPKKSEKTTPQKPAPHYEY